MGWLFRKSVKFGLMRINFSNRGISYSAGIKGARINTGPRGTFVTIGSNGIYYRQKIGAMVNERPRPVLPRHDGNHTITSAPINELTDVDSKGFVDELTEKAGKISFKTWFGICPMVLFVAVLSLQSLKSREIVTQKAVDRNLATIDSYVGANIRSLPNGNSDILRTAKNGEEFSVIDSTNKKWFKIGFNDSVGYVSKKLAIASIVHDPEQLTSEFYSTNPYYLLLLGGGVLFFLVLIYYLSRMDKKRFEMEINYEMDEQMSDIYKAFSSHFSGLISSHRKWQYLHRQRNDDWKRNAGAGKLINRVAISQISADKKPIKYFKTNILIPHIKLRNTELFFLPERLLVRRGNKFAAVFYKNLSIEASISRFIEEEMLPRDATVVAHTWKYVKRSGGPDRRFKNNRQIPICNYSQYTIKSATGVYETICTSKLGAFDRFGQHLGQIGQLQSKMQISEQIS